MTRTALIADRLWDGVADQVVVGAAVIINGETIDSIVSVSALEAGLPRQVLPGVTLMPGLIDAHVHFSSVMGPAFLAAGVTTIRDVGNDLEWILVRRALHATQATIGPAIVCCGQLHDGPKAIWPRMGHACADAVALEASIRHHVARGVDQIKLYAGLNADMVRAGVAEGHRLGKFVLAHLGATDAATAAHAGLDEFEHLAGCDVAWGPATDEQDDAMIDLLLARGVVIDPTLVVWDRLGRILDRALHCDERRAWVHPCHRALWDAYRLRFDPPAGRLRLQAAIPHMKRFLRRAHGRGVRVALGTDSPFPHLTPGFSVHDELAMYVDAGLRPIDALRAATSVNAQVLGLASRAGVIAPGAAADLLAVSGNPLERIEEISGITAVWRRGVAMNPADLLASVRTTFSHRPDDAITNDLQAYVDGRR